MLIFDRKEFRAGVQLVREEVKVKDADGKDAGTEIKEYRFTPADKKKAFAFVDETAVLKKYPHMFKKA